MRTIRPSTLWALAALLAAGVASAHPHPKIGVRIDPSDSGQLQIAVLADQRPEQVLYRSEGTILDAKVSPSYSRVAVLEAFAAADDPNLRAAPRRLVVVEVPREVDRENRAIEQSARVLASVDRPVHRLVFAPSGRRLAALTGSHYPTGVGFQPEGLLLLDIDSGEVRDVPGIETAFDVNWVRTSSGEFLHLRVFQPGGRRSVTRYDLDTGEIRPLDEPVFDVSPNGEFYLVRPYERIRTGECRPDLATDSCLRVRRIDSNEEVASFQDPSLGAVYGWVYGRGNRLLFNHTEYATDDENLIVDVQRSESVVWDAKTGREIARFEDCRLSRGAEAGDLVTGSAGIACADSRWPQKVLEEPKPEVAPPPEPQPQLLPAPALGRPERDSEWRYANPRFAWEAVPGAEGYVVEVCGRAGCETHAVPDTRWQPTALHEGSYEWRVRAVDPDGVVGEAESAVPFTILSGEPDNEAPTGSLATGARGFSTSGVEYLPESTSFETRLDPDVSGVIDWYYMVNDKRVEQQVAAGPWPAEEVNLQVEAADDAGNQGTVDAREFRLDRRAPKIVDHFVDGGPTQLYSDAGSALLALSEGTGRGLPLGCAAGSGPRCRNEWVFETRHPNAFVKALGGLRFEGAPAAGGRTLWITAHDDDTDVARMTLRLRSPGSSQPVLEIEVVDIFGNAARKSFALERP